MDKDIFELPDFRQKRPFVMMHEGRDLFSEWFRQLIVNAESRSMPIDSLDDLNTAANIITSRLARANDEIRPSLMESHIDFLRQYTAMDAFAGRLDPNDRLKRHLDDTIWFFTHVPISLAADTWLNTERRLEPIGTAIKEILANPSFADCVGRIATTGFGVLRNNFGNISDYDGGRQVHRERLKAVGWDPQLIQVATEAGIITYSLAEWVTNSLLYELRRQNKKWPNDDASGILQCGQLRDMDPPISAGCPVRLISIGPLCRYLSEQIRTDL